MENKIKSNYLWLCPICKTYYSFKDGSKEKHIKEEIKEIKEVLRFLNKELSDETNKK